MQRKYSYPLIVAAGMLGVTAGASMAFASNQDNQANQANQGYQANRVPAGTEQRDEESESAIKDAWLHGKLESALLFNEHLNNFSIDTDVKHGIAYLKGAVESDIDRDLAGEIAKSINGVTEVENELVVDKAQATMSQNNEAAQERQGFKQSVGNATLTARVKSKLLMNGNTGGMAINVDSEKGVVTLSGEVKSSEEKDLAVKLASNTSGATSVTDELVVKSN